MAGTNILENPDLRKGKLTPVLALATLISAFGSSFQYGYNIAVVNSPAPFMQQFYNRTYSERFGAPIDDSFLTLLWSLTVSMFPLGGFLGSLMVAPLVNKLGRRGTLLFNNIFSVVPAVLMGASEAAESYEIIIAARVFVGICAGLSSNVVPMYLGELSPRNLRGAIGIVPQLFITIGILTAQILGIRSILGNTRGWPLMLALTGVPALLELLCLPFFPESPRYSLIQREDEEEARRALRRLRGWEDVDGELAEMRLEDRSERSEGRLSTWRLCCVRSLRWQLLSVVAVNVGQQLSGINAIYYYADSIYSSAGVKGSQIQYVTAGTGAVNVFMTVAAVFVVEAAGRRLLLLVGFGICCGACAVLTAALILQETVQWMPYLSIACVVIYVIGHAIGPSPIPYVVTTEIFRQASRPAAFMVAGSVHWLSNFTVGLLFPFLEKGLGAYSFIIFSLICLATLVYIFIVVPETKNKTFQEVSQLFAERNKTDMEMETAGPEASSPRPVCGAQESNPDELKTSRL
ncbi:solute carrier family 2, facilitated glucose transporter member 5 [Lepisosteus oculatus]|uniref:solute carrier family 2, facilitated glucose transporter member 5 n=1 Tax=Lepisosteus oculatus TaxID=7918 RepID=UPI003714BE0F